MTSYYIFLTVYGRIYCCKFFTLSNQTLSYKSKCIRISNDTNQSMWLCTYMGAGTRGHQKLEVWRGWYIYHGMYNTKHHNGLSLLSSVLEGFPRKALGHGSDTAGVAIVSCHKSGLSPLDNFYFFMLILKINFFKKKLSGVLSERPAVWIQIRTDLLFVLIWVQTVCKGYQ